MRPRLLALLAASAIALPNTAHAADDCPPGSVYRTEDGYSFCEPTVCENDAQCNPGTEVCRPIALCMQVGTLDPKKTALGDAGQRLVVTQRCAPDKTCPQTTTCSDKGRCITKVAAEKMGILAVPTGATNAAPASAPGGEKKNCGCRAVGAATEPRWGALLSIGALAMALARRRSRATPGQ